MKENKFHFPTWGETEKQYEEMTQLIKLVEQKLAKKKLSPLETNRLKQQLWRWVFDIHMHMVMDSPLKRNFVEISLGEVTSVKDIHLLSTAGAFVGALNELQDVWKAATKVGTFLILRLYRP